MARVSGIESGSPTPTACERTRLTLQLANLISDDVHIAQLADAGRNCVRNFIVGDESVDDRASAVDGLACVGIEENGSADVGLRHFAHRFESEIVSVDVQGLQGSSPVLSSQFSIFGRSPSAARCLFVTILSAETRSFPIRASHESSYQGIASAMPPSSKIIAPLGAANGRAKHSHVFLRQRCGVSFLNRRRCAWSRLRPATHQSPCCAAHIRNRITFSRTCFRYVRTITSSS